MINVILLVGSILFWVFFIVFRNGNLKTKRQKNVKSDIV